MWGRFHNLGNWVMSLLGSARPARSDKRQLPRFAARLETTYQAVGGDAEPQLPARVRDVSQAGIGLRVDRPHAPGSLLHIVLPNSNVLLACVVHATPAGEQEWHLGCTFIRELSTAELERFLS